MRPNVVLQAFDDYLAEHGLHFEAVVIGGAALALLGVTQRETRDCDVLDPNIPEKVRVAAVEFAKASAKSGIGLSSDWLNNGPADLKRTLPKGWETRLRSAYDGNALQLQTLGRHDLLATKLFALCDREIDADDCRRLAPNQDEVDALRSWLHEQDGNEMWPAHVDKRLAQLMKEIADVRS